MILAYVVMRQAAKMVALAMFLAAVIVACVHSVPVQSYKENYTLCWDGESGGKDACVKEA